MGEDFSSEETEYTELQVVYQCWNENEAAVVVSFLEGCGIRALMRRELPYGVFPVSVGKLGEIQVCVASKDAEKALTLLEEAQGEST